MLTDAVRTALTFCGRLTFFDLPVFPSLHDALTLQYDTRQIAKIATTLLT